MKLVQSSLRNLKGGLLLSKRWLGSGIFCRLDNSKALVVVLDQSNQLLLAMYDITHGGSFFILLLYICMIVFGTNADLRLFLGYCTHGVAETVGVTCLKHKPSF